MSLVSLLQVGHSIENDLRALQLSHGLIMDTSELFPHRDGGGRKCVVHYTSRNTPHSEFLLTHPCRLSLRSSLRHLAGWILQRRIQEGPHGARRMREVAHEQAAIMLTTLTQNTKRQQAMTLLKMRAQRCSWRLQRLALGQGSECRSN